MEIEIEQRYKVEDPDGLVRILTQNGVSIESEQRLIDKWYIPKDIHTREQHDVWFDKDHGIAFRIRSILMPDGTLSSSILESKQLTNDNNHNTFKEEVVIKDNKPAMESFLAEKGYYNWLALDKKRRKFLSKNSDLEVVMDSVAGIKEELGIDSVLELEYKGNASRVEALKIIDEFAKDLGLSRSQLFGKSLTVEAMHLLARFQ